jgi:hypothetical protein
VIRKKGLYEDRFRDMLTSAYQSFAEVSQKYNALGGTIVPENRRVDAGRVETDGPRPEALRRYLQSLSRMRGNLYSATGDKSGLESIESTAGIWNAIFAKVKEHHKELGYIDFETITVKQERVYLVVIVQSAGHGERLQALLNEIDYLRKMRPEGVNATPIRGSDKQRIPLEWKAQRG